MIGIIFSQLKLTRVVQGTEQDEYMPFYLNFARDTSTDLFFYTPSTIDGDMVTGYCYEWKTTRFNERETTVPQVNLIRTYISEEAYFKLKEISQRSSVRFFNLFCGRNKYELYKLLLEDSVVQPYLPATKRLNKQSFTEFLERYRAAIIKPLDGAFGERIGLLRKEKDVYTIQYIRNRKQLSKRFPTFTNCMEILRRLKRSAYLIQRYVPLQTYRQRAFDIRTSVQKGGDGKWCLTGKVARVASEDRFVTNLAQGGESVPLSRIERELSINLGTELEEVSIQVARRIEQIYPSAIDLGMDLALDQSNRLWLIEVNYCDQRYAYRQAKEFGMWEDSYRYPLTYVSLFK